MCGAYMPIQRLRPVCASFGRQPRPPRPERLKTEPQPPDIVNANSVLRLGIDEVPWHGLGPSGGSGRRSDQLL